MLVLFKVKLIFYKKKIIVIGLSWCLSLIGLIDAEIVLISFGLINKFEKDDTSLKILIYKIIFRIVNNLVYDWDFCFVSLVSLCNKTKT